mgnify:CR=1 FL=1
MAQRPMAQQAQRPMAQQAQPMPPPAQQAHRPMAQRPMAYRRSRRIGPWRSGPWRSGPWRSGSSGGAAHAPMMATLKATAFRQKEGEVSDAQMMMLLVIANEYNLNPFTRELYAYPDKQNGIVPVVSIDGWVRIINERPSMRGFEFTAAENMVTPDGGKPCPEWMEIVIHRSDRDHPVTIREYLDEVYRPPFEGKRRDGTKYSVPGPWQSHTKRMLRHKTLIQGARIAFGFGGIFDEDEAQRIVERNITGEAEVVSRTQEPVVQRKSEAAAAGQASTAPAPAALDNAPGITLEQLVGKLDACENRDQYDDVQAIAYDVLQGDELKAYKKRAATTFARIAEA